MKFKLADGNWLEISASTRHDPPGHASNRRDGLASWMRVIRSSNGQPLSLWRRWDGDTNTLIFLMANSDAFYPAEINEFIDEVSSSKCEEIYE